MRHFLIITNTYKDENGRLTGELAAYIRKKDGECDCFYSDGERKSEAAPALDKMDPATDCVMVLGGDGTLIRAASRLVDSRIPLIGVNLGTVGYLCELEESNVFDAVDRLMADDCMVEERMMLTGAGILGGVREEYGVALNDIVIHRTGELSVVSLIVYGERGVSAYVSGGRNHCVDADRFYRLQYVGRRTDRGSEGTDDFNYADQCA